MVSDTEPIHEDDLPGQVLALVRPDALLVAYSALHDQAERRRRALNLKIRNPSEWVLSRSEALQVELERIEAAMADIEQTLASSGLAIVRGD